MRQSTRRRRLEQSQRGWAVLPRGPFGPVKIRALAAQQCWQTDISAGPTPRGNKLAGLGQSGGTKDRSMSMTEYFAYLHDHQATTDLAKAFAEIVMLRTSGAGPVRARSDHERMAS